MADQPDFREGCRLHRQVQAADADAAIKATISKYDIEAKYHDRVAARPIVKAG